EDALSTADAALRLFPDYADLHYHVGVICLERHEFRRAYSSFTKCLQSPEQPARYASFSGVRGFRTHYQLGRLAEAFLNDDEAMNCYVASLRDNASFVPALEGIIRLLRPSKDPEQAEAGLEILCELCTAEAHLLVAGIMFDLAAYDLAEAHVAKAESLGDVPEDMRLVRAICLAQSGRYLDALRIVNSFRPDTPYYTAAMFNKMVFFWLQENLKKTRSAARDLLTMGVRDDVLSVARAVRASLEARKPGRVPVTDIGMSVVLEVAGRGLHAGKKPLVDLLIDALDPRCVAEHALQISGVYSLYGHVEDAERHCRAWLEQVPTSASAWASLADMEAATGRDLLALEHYQKAIELAPDDPGFHVKLIRCYDAMRERFASELAGWEREGVNQ
ncbi:MAG: tetratricopeptide repeat protein, partial [Firmicutes bacterium]|nr:tetratricopeptide repeat protein [Bacillota bacterium]